MNNQEQVIEGAVAGGENKSTARRRRILFSMLASGLATLCALVLSEVALRLLVDQDAKRLATYDQTLGWRGRPNGQGVYVRKSDDIRVPFRYNNLGFRDEDVGPKRSGVHRLLLLGDSFIENLEVDYERTFPAVCETLIQSRSSDWEVANIGSQGYSTSQELLAFREFGKFVAPDAVLLCFYCGNDYEDNLRRRFAYLDESGQLQFPRNQDSAWKRHAKWLQRWLYESSHLVFLLKNTLEDVAHIEIAPTAKLAADADEQYKQKITRQLVSRMAAEVRQSGAEFGVVVIPSRDHLVSGVREPSAAISTLCREQGLPCLDLWSVLSIDDFFETDIHFNVRGHEKVARVIDEFLVNEFLKPELF